MSEISRKHFMKMLGTLGAAAVMKPASASVMQPLQLLNSNATAKPKRVLRIAHLTDIHIKEEYTAEKGFARALHAVNNLADKPDVIINGGDAIMNAVALSKENVKSQWQAFHRTLNNENSIPVKHCIGNHDLFGWAMPGSNKADGKQWAMDEYQLTKPYYSFQQGNWKVIVLDSIHSRKSIPGYYGKLDEAQLEWLQHELNNTHIGVNVCVISHIPILAICTLFDDAYLNHNYWFVPDNTLHADAPLLRDLFYKSGNVKCCLSGHIHMIDHVNYLGTDYYCNGAVSGGWWKGNHQQFAPAFAIINLFEDGSVTREIVHYNWKDNA